MEEGFDIYGFTAEMELGLMMSDFLADFKFEIYSELDIRIRTESAVPRIVFEFTLAPGVSKSDPEVEDFLEDLYLELKVNICPELEQGILILIRINDVDMFGFLV